MKRKLTNRSLNVSLFLLFLFNINSFSQKKPFTFSDAMKFKAMKSPIISENGKWVGFYMEPDRGDPIAYAVNVEDTTRRESVNQGVAPKFSDNSLWFAVTVRPPALVLENTPNPKERPKNSIEIINLENSKRYEIENVANYKFSNNSKWLVARINPDPDLKSKKMKSKIIGSPLIIHHLQSGTDIRINFVTEFVLDSNSKYIFYAVSDTGGRLDGIYGRNLEDDYAPEFTVVNTPDRLYSNLAMPDSGDKLAYILSTLKKDGAPDNGSLSLWTEQSSRFIRVIAPEDKLEKGWFIPYKNTLKWTDDGARLFFGMKPIGEKDTSSDYVLKYTDSSFYNIDSITSKRDVIIWNSDDQRIKSNEKKWWEDNNDRTFTAIFDMTTGKYIRLGDSTLSNVVMADDSNYTIAYDDSPYLKRLTWDGSYFDLYLVNLKTGAKKLLAKELQENAHLSPKGKYVVYFQKRNWQLYIVDGDSTFDLTKKLPYHFWDDENDTPAEPSSLGFEGWIGDQDDAFLVNDKFDTWMISCYAPGTNLCMTGLDGRSNNLVFRPYKLDPDMKFYGKRDTLYFDEFNRKIKTHNIYWLDLKVIGGISYTKDTLDTRLIAKAKHANVYLYSVEDFDKFPDLWVTDRDFAKRKQITNFNNQLNGFKWGKTEVIHYVTPLKDSLDGFFIKPDGYKPGKKYPCIVYFYERFSDYAHDFSQPRVNHRPLYQVYLGSDYVVFLPDIKYHNGRPGFDANDAISAGLDTLVARGIIDPDKICLQGHSWGGYETAFLITGNKRFKAACAGAPVGNMTSAYNEIRLESGMAREFQYEKEQSRIGGNLWDSLDAYIRNSPVFGVPKVETPLLIYHGDEDEAVPFSQGVELYLAMRRLDKNCILLQYEKEPHHPRKYQNKLDYAIKMKQFFDHYVLGTPAPSWMNIKEEKKK